MSQPRVTVSLGRDGKRVERRVSVSTEMYADRVIGARNFRKRSVRDRLGGQVEPAPFTRPVTGKRPREDDGKWKHDMFEDKMEEDVQASNGRLGSQDLRMKLARQTSRVDAQRNGGVVDLREKLSGPISQRPPATQAQGGAELQRRIASVIYPTSNVNQGVPSTTTPAPVPARSTATQKTTAKGDEQSVTSLLHSLGLGKYCITFQAEEVDMAALQQMGENDLKELGVPMGPRKKILLAVRGRG